MKARLKPLSRYALGIALVFPLLAQAQALRVAGIFSDHMVLQRGVRLPVWGWAEPESQVSVSLAGHTRGTRADAQGSWRVNLPAMKAGGPYTLTVTGSIAVSFEDVLVGEVWLCSGQSNMEMTLRPAPDGVFNAEQEAAAARYPKIRLFTVPRGGHFEPQPDLRDAGWKACHPETVVPFSAAAYFFGRRLHEELGVPVGLIDCSRGASNAEAWTRAGALAALPEFAPLMAQWPAQLAEVKRRWPEYAQAMDAYRKLWDERDVGQRNGEALWAQPDLDTQDWKTMQVPDYWENQGFAGFDGAMWMSKEIEVPAEWAGRPLLLGVCTVNDKDRAYVNGREVGRYEKDAGWTAPRVYPVPAECLRPGRNVITVRVFDVGSKGGICGEAKDLWLRPAEGNATPLSLAGTWQLKPGLDLTTLPPAPEPPALDENNPRTPTALFNGMLHPLIPYAMRGAIWYQGESNVGRAAAYRALFPGMIQDWRALWGQGAFPFLFVQLAGFGAVNPEPEDAPLSALREAQTAALKLRHTAMATTADIGDPANIHPRNKQEVGRRLALAALRTVYHRPVDAEGPRFKRCIQEGNRLRLVFDTRKEALASADGKPLTGFAVAGVDRQFHWAEARIEGRCVVLSCPAVPQPVAARYAWSATPVSNLANAGGLPAAPFRTDRWPLAGEKAE